MIYLKTFCHIAADTLLVFTAYVSNCLDTYTLAVRVNGSTSKKRRVYLFSDYIVACKIVEQGPDIFKLTLPTCDAMVEREGVKLLVVCLSLPLQ